MKFFKQKEKLCSICKASNPTKHAKPFWYFCEKCWNETYQKVAPKVFEQINTAKQTGKIIDIKDAKELSNNITKEIIKDKKIDINDSL